MLLWAQPAGADSAPPADLIQQLADLFGDYNRGAYFPLPELSERQLQRLARGKILRIRDSVSSPEGPQRITGLLLCEAPFEDLWVAFRDTHLTSLPVLTEYRLSEDGEWPSRWYQFFHMPGPFADRHWVIAVDDNIPLARSSGNRLWEHYWSLLKGGLTEGLDRVAAGRVPRVLPQMAKEAIRPGTNEGAWLLIRLNDGRSVLGYTVRASIGGRVPDRLVSTYSMMTLAKLLRGVAATARRVPEHYDAQHSRIRGGGGEPVP
ncbi:MAG: hypothetical protein CMP23_13220 [Rickettsiales bacterium]|nr:hypothetical protein [Rickettsiales bacterium]